jgi:hypothetical protein
LKNFGASISVYKKLVILDIIGNLRTQYTEMVVMVVLVVVVVLDNVVDDHSNIWDLVSSIIQPNDIC